MSIYGDLSKAQRILLTALYGEIPEKRAVSIGTALRARGKQLQTVGNLRQAGLVDVDKLDKYSWDCRVFLTALGVDVMRRVARERKTARYVCRHRG